jgi:hypothetical protein
MKGLVDLIRTLKESVKDPHMHACMHQSINHPYAAAAAGPGMCGMQFASFHFVIHIGDPLPC